jgi:thiol-disulfide isomerase/thioredoxin
VAQAPTDIHSGESADAYLQSWSAINNLLLSGRSWSGRERNCCFLNTGGSRFADISAVTGLDFIEDGRAVATVDWDCDGDLDFWIVTRNAPQIRFLRNDLHNDHHFLAVKLQGRTCNRDAIGARLELYAEDSEKPRIQTLHSSEGFLSQSSKWVHFGLGTTDHINRLVVRWPDATVEEYRDLQVDRRYTIDQGGQPQTWDPPQGKVALVPTPLQVPASSAKARIVLEQRIPMPPMSYLSFEGKPLSLNDHPGQPLLINVWASWCEPCLVELADFKKHQDRLLSKGLKIVAVSVDGLEDGELRDATPALRVLETMQFPFDSGIAPETLAANLERAPGLVLNKRAPLPIPSSLLIDKQDRLAIIYTGPVSANQLESDLDLLEASTVELRAAALPFRGRWLDDPIVEQSDEGITANRLRINSLQWFVVVMAVAVATFFVWLRFRKASIRE